MSSTDRTAEGSRDRLPRRLSWQALETEASVRELARFVRGGGLVLFPTESSYALGADPRSVEGVAAVFRIKGRPADKPLPVVAGDFDGLEQLGVDSAPAKAAGVAGAWPGPLTVVLPCRTALPAACGRRELAVRIPGHSRLRRLLRRAGLALTATSANLAGAEPLLSPEEFDGLIAGERVLVIDEGRLPGGAPSTVVRVEGNALTVLRAGAVSAEALRRLAAGLDRAGEFSAEHVEIPVEESD